MIQCLALLLKEMISGVQLCTSSQSLSKPTYEHPCKNGVRLWLLSFQSQLEGCVFKVFEEHGFMINEDSENDSLLSISLLEMWKTVQDPVVYLISLFKIFSENESSILVVCS